MSKGWETRAVDEVVEDERDDGQSQAVIAFRGLFEVPPPTNSTGRFENDVESEPGLAWKICNVDWPHGTPVSRGRGDDYPRASTAPRTGV